MDEGCTLDWGPGMISESPRFADPEGGDFHLFYSSPCRDAGDNGAAIEPFDFEGDPRVAWGGVVDIGADEFFNHFYIAGQASPGEEIEGRLVGKPRTAPLGLVIGSGILAEPLNTPWGDFWLEEPWLVLPIFSKPGIIPSEGVLILRDRIPALPEAPYDIPLQALIGLGPDALSNPEMLEVR